MAVVALLLYLVITWLRRRATWSAVALLGIVLLLYVLARWLNMYLTLALFEVGVTVLALGFLIVFQKKCGRGRLARAAHCRRGCADVEIESMPRIVDIAPLSLDILGRHDVGAKLRQNLIGGAPSCMPSEQRSGPLNCQCAGEVLDGWFWSLQMNAGVLSLDCGWA